MTRARAPLQAPACSVTDRGGEHKLGDTIDVHPGAGEAHSVWIPSLHSCDPEQEGMDHAAWKSSREVEITVQYLEENYYFGKHWKRRRRCQAQPLPRLSALEIADTLRCQALAGRSPAACPCGPPWSGWVQPRPQRCPRQSVLRDGGNVSGNSGAAQECYFCTLAKVLWAPGKHCKCLFPVQG